MSSRVRLWRAVFARRRAVVAVGVALAAAGLIAATQVELRTSRRELAPEGDAEQARMDRLEAEFRGASAVVAGIEGTGSGVDRRTLEACADTLVAELERVDRVTAVHHELPADWLLRAGLWLAPPETVRSMADFAESFSGGAPVVLDGFAALNAGIARALVAGLESGSARSDAEAVRGIDGLTRLLELQRDLAEGGDGGREKWLAPPLSTHLESAVAAAGRDVRLRAEAGALFLVVASPASADDSLPALRELDDDLRAASVLATGDRPCRITWTGTPVMTVEEMSAVRGDSYRAAILAVLAVGLLTTLVFRDRSHVIVVLAALAVGLAWAIGAVRVHPGYLNMITSSFLSTLIGVGIAYGIHPVSEYELQRETTDDVEAAVRRAWDRTAAGVTVAGVTTSAAFFSILLMKFPGFSEMGWVAGQGVLLCLAAMMLVLPAFLLVWGRRRPRPRGRAWFDRLWGDRAVHRITRAPRATLVVAGAVTLAAIAAVPTIEFDTDVMKLLPRRAPSLQLMERLARDPEFSPVYNLAPVADRAALADVHARAATEPTIGAVRSIADLLPEDPAASAREIDRLAAVVERVRIVPRPPDLDAWRASIAPLGDAFEEAADLAFDAGIEPLVAALEEGLDVLDALDEALAGATPASLGPRVEAWFRALDARREEAVDALRAPAPDPDSLPEGLRRRFVTDTGRFVAYLYPAGNVYDPPALAAYVEASRRVHPESIGFPVMLDRMSARITDGFSRAVALAALLVFAILWIDFRSWRDTALALVPLAVGVAWMLGGMRLLGLHFNFANLVAVPLILGVGIDNGVHVVHRWRLEGDEGMDVVLKHTGRAIWIASGTTLVGFGSLALADHRGLAGLGTALILGVGACLVSSTIVLPNLLAWLDRRRSAGRDRGVS